MLDKARLAPNTAKKSNTFLGTQFTRLKTIKALQGDWLSLTKKSLKFLILILSVLEEWETGLTVEPLKGLGMELLNW